MDLKNLTPKTQPVIKKVAKPVKKAKTKAKNTYYLPLSMALKISDNYAGISDSIGGVLHDLPMELKNLFNASGIKSIVVNQGTTLIVLKDGYTFRFNEVFHANKPHRELTIKLKGKRVFHKYFKI